MSVYSISFEAPKIPFRPNQCPNCKNYENKQCTAYTERRQAFGTSTVTIAAVFEGESQEPCPKYASNASVTPVDTLFINALLEQPYGSALPMSVNDSGHVVTALIFRESKARIAELASLGALARMQTRAAFLEVSGVEIYVTLFTLGDQVFEIWWNWHNPVVRPVFERLFEQKEVVVGFVSDQPVIDHIVRHPSPIQDGLRTNRSKLVATQAWTMEAFDNARAAVEKEYPTPVILWKVLGGGSYRGVTPLDDVTQRYSHQPIIPMTTSHSQQIFEVEAESLEEAREQVKSKKPQDMEILSEKIISDGKPKTAKSPA